MAKDALEIALAEPTEDDLKCLELSHAPHLVVSELEVEAPELAKAKG